MRLEQVFDSVHCYQHFVWGVVYGERLAFV